MITEDQSKVIALLSSPETHGGGTVERIKTHASIVFLAGDRARKLKRAVRYDYLDYSTADRRRAMCKAASIVFSWNRDSAKGCRCLPSPEIARTPGNRSAPGRSCRSSGRPHAPL